MNLIDLLFGQGKDLNALQMSCRAIVVFAIALVLIRVSGRRSFGVRAPLDNFIIICLGAVLSRAIVGASAFVPVIISCFVIVCLHRMLGWLISRSPKLGRMIEGNKIILYQNGNFIDKNLNRVQVCREDVMQSVRKSALTEDMQTIDKIYMERNGDISAIRKS